MPEQPLHEICDEIWHLQNNIRYVSEKLEQNFPIKAHDESKIIYEKLGKILTRLREKALREEGEHHVVNETYMGTKPK